MFLYIFCYHCQLTELTLNMRIIGGTIDIIEKFKVKIFIDRTRFSSIEIFEIIAQNLLGIP